MRHVLLTLACILLATFAHAEPFEIKDGDRVLFLGDTLLEREGTYGYLETRMAEQFPDRKFTVRNLAFSADTPLGWSRASFDAPAKGFERLKEQLALVKPTVVFLGYGMAASLQEMTDRSQDWTLNRDPARYGAEPMSAARFKKELAQCMDAIEESGRAGFQPAVPGILPGTSNGERPAQRDTPSARNPDGASSRDGRKPTPDAPGKIPGAAGGTPALPDSNAVRFVLLSPIRHEDLRATRPGLPDPAEHNKLLEQYTKAIEELAKERGARFVNFAAATAPIIPAAPRFGSLRGGPSAPVQTFLTDNGIHLDQFGYAVVRHRPFASGMGWTYFAWQSECLQSEMKAREIDRGLTPESSRRAYELETNARKLLQARDDALRAAIIRKNELFFHRWRPANETYLFGFRKREQGKNGAEIPMFDPLIEKAEAEIERLKAEGVQKAPKKGAFLSPETPERLAEIHPASQETPGRSNEFSPARSEAQERSAEIHPTDSEAPGRSNESHPATQEAQGCSNESHSATQEAPGRYNESHPATQEAPGLFNESHSAAQQTPGRSNESHSAAQETPGRSNKFHPTDAEAPICSTEIAARRTEAPAAPILLAQAATPDPARQTPAETPDLAKVAASPSTLPLPTFTLADGLEITLWAENPLLAKPTQCNWDAQGRLWVASSAMYPMIAPGQAKEDKIIILEDPGHTGKATKSTVFVDGLLIPTGVAPVLVAGESAQSSVLSAQSSVPSAQSSVLSAQSSVPSAQKNAAGAPERHGDFTFEREPSAQKGGSKPEIFSRGTITPIVPNAQKSAAGAPSSLSTDPLSTEHSAPRPRWACYVGQSTELLYFEDTDGDGKADRKRIVFSGFGTEDTHHIVHTLRWGPDGRLYFSQSVYIHTHLETPWGVVRVNSGGVFAYDPRTERVEVVEKGLWNTWGHAWDQWGQSFYTDGAGSSGISWGFPGATFAPNEGARRTMPSISPGSYPKFAGLELIYSPHFPADWQGSAVTCDFRAHKIVHFKINDLGGGVPGGGTQASQPVGGNGKAGSQPAIGGQDVRPPAPSPQAGSPRSAAPAVVDSPKSGYTTEQLPVLVQTSDATFRPIDVKLGPDGALYIADWSNPIINHGEVDFRDPRRDHEHGRIWRLSVKGGAAVKWESFTNWEGDAMHEKLLVATTSTNLWHSEQANQLFIQNLESPKTAASARATLDSALKEKTATLKLLKAVRLNRAMPARTPDSEPIGVLLSSFYQNAWAAVAGYFDPSKSEEARKAMMELQKKKPRDAASAKKLQELKDRIGALGESAKREPAREKEIKKEMEVLLKEFSDVLGTNGEFNRLVAHSANWLVNNPHPRTRVMAMRAFARISTIESASLILDAAVNAPKDDPYYEFAAWLSINDLAPQVAEWVEKNSADTASAADAPNAGHRASGSAGAPPAVSGAPPGTPDVERRPNSSKTPAERTTTPDASGGAPNAAGGAPALPDAAKSRDAKIVLALESLPADTTAPLLSKILAARGIPRDGTGPWIELIGKAGDKAALQKLFERVAESGFDHERPKGQMPRAKDRFDEAAGVRALNALAEAARLRNLRPGGPLAHAVVLIHSDYTGIRTAAARLAGLWNLPEAAPLLETLAKQIDAAQRAAAFEGLRSLGGEPAIAVLQKLVRSDFAPVPPAALAALAHLKPAAAIAEIPAVLGAIQSDPELLATWRGIFQSKGAVDQLSANFPANLPKPIVTAALRAARELGRPGQRLIAKLTPLAGESAASTVLADYNDLAARAKKDGDPVAGEAMYRRMASACTTCHAIGGAGGKLGPDMTSIGASAPPDYIIESILNPAAKVKEGYHAFTFAMKDGSEAIGIPSRETATEQFIRTLAGEQALPKANIVSKKIAEGGASLMPAGLTAAWSDRERLNLYAFLGELGRPGPFDASKNNVARVWQLTDSEKVDGALKPEPNAITIPAYTLVDGRLTKDLLAEKLAMLAPKKDAVHLTARFQAATAGKTKFNLTGIRKAWLDGQPLAIASEPSPSVDLSAGAHVFTIEVDAKTLPEVVRVESPAVSFLGD